VRRNSKGFSWLYFSNRKRNERKGRGRGEVRRKRKRKRKCQKEFGEDNIRRNWRKTVKT